MTIALVEQFPLLETRLLKLLRRNGAGLRVSVERARTDGIYDLVLCDRNSLSPTRFAHASLCLVPSFARVDSVPADILLCGGMNPADPVTLSSISEQHAMLCLQQEVIVSHQSIVPFEKRIPFDHGESLFKNIAAGFALTLAELVAEEDK